MLRIVARRQDDVVTARAELERVVAMNAGLSESWKALGVVRYRSQNVAAAIGAWQHIVALDPCQHEAWLNLGLVEAGDRGAARTSRAPKALLVELDGN